MSTAKKTWAAGDEVSASDLNGNFEGNKYGSLICGETIGGGTTPVPIVILNDFRQWLVGNNVLNLGNVSGNTRQSIKFKGYASTTSTQIKVVMKKVGSPTDDLTLEIQGDSGGSPDGTAITNGTSNTLGGGSVTTQLVEYTFTFASAFTLAANTTYWLVFKRSGATNGSNYYQIADWEITSYGNFSSKVYNGGSWSANTALPYFYIIPTTGGSASIWKSDANIQGLHFCHGYCIENGTENNVADVQFDGVVTGLSGLTIGEEHFVQDTAGTVGLSRGTYSIFAGKAVSATELDISGIEKSWQWICNLEIQVSTSTDVTTVIPHKTNYIILHVTFDEDTEMRGQFTHFLERSGKSTASMSYVGNTANDDFSYSIGWTGTVLTLSEDSDEVGTNTTMTVSMYLYQ